MGQKFNVLTVLMTYIDNVETVIFDHHKKK